MILFAVFSIATVLVSASAREHLNGSSYGTFTRPSAGHTFSSRDRLHARQLICPAGLAICPSGRSCCPVGGQCCPGDVWCPEGQVCMTDENGHIGCCPIGETCGGISGCAASGYVECADDTFCCPFGHSCSRLNGIPTCQGQVLMTIAPRQTIEPPPVIPPTDPGAPPPISTPPATPPPITDPGSTPSTVTAVTTIPVNDTTTPFLPPEPTPPPNSTIPTLPSNSTSNSISIGTDTTPFPPTITDSLLPPPSTVPDTGTNFPSPPSPTAASITSSLTFDNQPLVTASQTTASLAPVPTNATVTPTSPDITYAGNWTPSTPVCNTTTASMRCVGAGNSFKYSFKGTAIFLNLAVNPDGGLYSVDLDGETKELDSYSADNSTCKVGFEKTDLSNTQHTITIMSLGPSSLAPVTSQGGLDVESIIVTTENPRSGAISIILDKRMLTAVFGVIIWFIISERHAWTFA